MINKVKYKSERIEDHINYVTVDDPSCNRTPYYYVTIIRNGKYFNRSFAVLEDARKYKEAQLEAIKKERFYVAPVDEKYEYPMNLARALFSEEELGEMDIDYLINEFPKNVEWVFENKEVFQLRNMKEIFDMRFKEYNTLDEAGKRIGRTRERVRQVEAKLIRMFRSPSVRRILKFGPAVAQLQIDVKRLEDQLSDMKQRLEKQINEIKNDKNYVVYPTLEELELSVRAYNCLRRANISTVKEIQEYGIDSLSKIRNMGRKSVREIQRALESYGIELE